MDTYRADEGLAFMLRYENIAWYEDGIVRILDRREYPEKIRFEICKSHTEVAQAIKDMVTQSAGPYTAAAMGMALAAFECRDRGIEEQTEYLKKAAEVISNARPTTARRMAQVTGRALRAAKAALAKGCAVSEAIAEDAIASNNDRYDKIGKIAGFLVERFPENGTVMTQCFAETIVGQMLKECRRLGRRIRLFCPETRPFFQGSRLTATVCHEMGFDVTVITDNMPAFVMQQEKVDIFTSAADVIAMDGHVVNKVGTFQISICADRLGVPYYVTGAPDFNHPDIDSVKIEFRNPEEVLYARGVRTAAQGVKGYYPAFDITPPELVKGVVTDRGIYLPTELAKYYEDGTQNDGPVV